MAIPTRSTPQDSRDRLHNIMDPSRWTNFPFRDGDVVIGTWAKSGTTWCQQIVTQLIFNGQEGLQTMDLAPWVELRVFPFDGIMAQLEAQTHRRCLKTHLPADALIISPKAKYIYIGRDGRDVIWSWYNHSLKMTDEFYGMLNSLPGRVGPVLSRPTADVRQFFHDWLDQDAAPFWPYWTHVQSWWEIRDAPNVMLLHFNDLKADMPAEIRKIAKFLDISIDETAWPAIVEHCTFDYMKANADTLSPTASNLFEGGLTSFVYKGTNDRWRDVLTPDEIRKYEETAHRNLSADCADWLANGSVALRR